MRILHICKKPPYPKHDGESIAISSFIEAWVMQGYTVDCIVLHTQKHPFDLDLVPDEIRSAVTFHPFYIDTTITLSGIIKNISQETAYNIDRFYSSSILEAIILRIGAFAHEIDIIQAEGLFVHRYAVYLKRSIAKHTIYIYRSHNIEFKIWQTLAENTSNFVKRKYFSYLSHKIKKEEIERLNTSDIHLDISIEDLNYWKRRNIRITNQSLPTGINLEVAKTIDHNYSLQSVGFLGALDWSPNIQGLEWFHSRIWSKIFTKETETCKIAGKNAQDKWLQEVRVGIDCIGEVSDAQAYMQSLGIFIVPLLSGSGIRIKLIEAMSLGLPILSTPIGAEGLGVQKDVHMLISDDQEEWQILLIRLMGDKALRKRLGEKAKEYAIEKFGLESMTRNWQASIEEHEKKHNV